MGPRPWRPCRARGCNALVQRGSLCPEHSAERNAQRGTAHVRGYGAHWQRRRAMWLAEHPLCVDPDGVHEGSVVLATDVDHIVPKRLDGADDETNFQSLCHACHSRKTLREITGRAGGGETPSNLWGIRT